MGVLKNVPQNVAPIVEGKRVRVLTIVAPIILLSLILPTWDVTSDWLLILEFFTGEFDTCLSRNWTHPCPQDNCAIWKGCTYRGPNNTESCGYCKEHPSVCDSQINFGFMLLGKLFWMLDIMYKKTTLQFRSSYPTLKVFIPGGLKHPIRSSHSFSHF